MIPTEANRPPEIPIRKIPMETIRAMAARIAETFHPEIIILFGSYARGDANEHSDVDLLVVLKECPPRGQRSAPMRLMLAKEFHEPVDIVVRSASTFDAWRDVFHSVSGQAAREGIVLYAKTG